MEPPKPFPAEAVPFFREGISLTLSMWSALQMAVENEWGGRNSRARANELCEDIFNWFTQSKEPHYIDDLEDKLDEGLISLNTEAQDGSIGEVAENLMILHEECMEGNYSSIEKLREASTHRDVHSHVRQVMGDDDDTSDSDTNSMGETDSQMMTDASLPDAAPVGMSIDEEPSTNAIEAEDGWTVVGSRKPKGRKK
ncbi:hypothetical protein SAY87_028028 [Trapa incisa]|uniref:Pre-rRNA-processing protein TSR2 homolog n=2 Tax=Trapa TaxID=22665 RepID=A0AAN7MD24_TRANT|nr:hypothetical protein SAY87_028028 [Trapa incisa]KAK4801296.1 hypothetical protein SAY86_021783 [Trapa natans]